MSEIVYRNPEPKFITTNCDLADDDLNNFVKSLNESTKKHKFVGTLKSLKDLNEQYQIHFSTSPYAWDIRAVKDGSAKGLYFGLLLSNQYECIYSVAVCKEILEHLTSISLFDLKLMAGIISS